MRQAMLPEPLNMPIEIWGQPRAQWQAQHRGIVDSG
jgi:hypothetical protein